MRLSVRYALLAAPLLTATVLVLGSVPPANAAPVHHGWHTRAVTSPRGPNYPGFDAISCVGARSCVAGGANFASRPPTSTAAFVDTEAAGKWSRRTELTMPSAGSSSAQVSGLGCWSAGNCAAVGNYLDASGAGQAFAAAETRGRWATAQPILLPGNASQNPHAELTAVSCSGPSSCQAVGGYNVPQAGQAQPGLMMAVTDKHGTWRRATEIAAPAGAPAPTDAFLTAVSCSSTAFCVAVGRFASNTGLRPLVAIESAGRWHRARQVAMPAGTRLRAAGLDSVSCIGGDSCVAVGGYVTNTGVRRAFFVRLQGSRLDQVAAVTTQPARGGPITWLDSVSCQPGFCVALGGQHLLHMVAVTYARGSWADAVQISPPPNVDRHIRSSFSLQQLSCLRSGACTAVGSYTNSKGDPELAAASRP